VKKYTLIAIFITLFLVIYLYFSSPKNFWICLDNQWQTKGHPQTSQPLTSCPKKTVLPDNQVDCLNLQGEWGPVGIYPQPICQLNAADFGRKCYDSSECQGRCMADFDQEKSRKLMSKKISLSALGYCSQKVFVVGCMPEVKQGKVNGIICYD